MRTPQSAKLSETQVDTKLEKPQVEDNHIDQ